MTILASAPETHDAIRIPRTDGTPVVVTLECPDCHAEWEAFGVMVELRILGDTFVPTSGSDRYCSCGTRGKIKGRPHTTEPDPDRALEVEWERGHFRD